jgi:magnesium transporter
MQHLLARAVWDEDAVRDDVRASVVEHLGDPEAVLVIDETGDRKKGTGTVGVKRQDTGALSGSGFLSRWARAETAGDAGAHEHSGGVMASARTTYQDGHTFVWVSLDDPSPEELASVQHEFGLPGPLVDDLGTAAKRSALNVFGELLVARVTTTTWVAAEEAVRLGEVQLVLGDAFVITVDGDTAALEGVRQDLQAHPELVGAGPAAVLSSLLDHAIDGYGPVLSALNDAVDEVAKAVFSPTRARPTERLYQLARQALEFRQATAPGAAMLDRLATGSPAPTGERLRRRFGQQRAHLQRLVDGADVLGNLLANLLQANLTQVSVRQYDDMRRISAYAGIWAALILPASIYGMNFRHMPELNARFGYPLALVTMVVICLTLYRGFRRSGWL